MKHAPFTQEWAEALRLAIDSDAGYRAAAGTWTWPIALVLSAAPKFGYPSDVAVELALDRGSCTSAKIVLASTVTAPFVFRADYAAWKDMVLGKLDPLAAVTNHQVLLSGSIVTLMVHAKAIRALVACAQQVPTILAGEP